MKRIFLILTMIFVMLPSWVNATLIGDEVLIAQSSTSSGVLRDDLVTVGSGVELSCPGVFELCGANIPGVSQGSIDIGASSILFNLGSIISAVFLSDIFNGYTFSDLDWTNGPGIITGVSLNTDVDGLDLSRISFGDDFVAVNFESLQLDSNDTFFEITLATSHSVPEPGSLALLCLGLAGVGIARRKKLNRG